MVKTGLSKQKLFGMIALSMGLVTQEQLQECLDIQRDSLLPRQLGGVMMSRGYLTEAQVREVLAVQGKTGETTSLPGSKSERKRLLGQILVERGYIDQDTLTAVLKRQELLRKSGIRPRIGELLIAIGKITHGQLSEALQMQVTA